jgi:hypothetical protein
MASVKMRNIQCTEAIRAVGHTAARLKYARIGLSLRIGETWYKRNAHLRSTGNSAGKIRYSVISKKSPSIAKQRGTVPPKAPDRPGS